jgi:hypothetical protein
LYVKIIFYTTVLIIAIGITTKRRRYLVSERKGFNHRD